MKRHALIAFALTVGLLFAADAAQEGAKNELKKLEGTWVMVAGEEKGEKVPEKRLKIATMTIVGDKHTVKVGEESFVGTHKLDPTKNPKEIDSLNQGKAMFGIYKLEKGEFTVCFAPPGKERPKEFTTKSGSGEFLHVWKQKKE